MEYIEKLDQEQRVLFLMVLAHIAHADGLYDEDENEFIQTMAYMYNIPEGRLAKILDVKTSTDVAEKVSVLKSDRSISLFLAREMFTLAHADGQMSDEEILAITTIGDALGISLDKLEEISEWVVEGMDWQERGYQIFEQAD